MRKVLRIVAISTGIVSAVAVTILGCIYLEDIAGYIRKIKAGKLNKSDDTKYIG